jgi:DNA-binding NtrC family response regulator
MKPNKRILIIDDDPNLLEVLTEYLARNNFEVVCSSDGMEGLERIETDPIGFDLIITDIIMPCISGIGLLKIIKDKYQRIPVIAMTGAGHIAEETSKEEKADVVIFKPFKLIEIKSTIDRLLDSNPGTIE